MRDHVTFQQILVETAEAAGARLVQRARLASSIAKTATNLRSRRAAYGVKHRAIEHGVERFAQAFALSGLEEDGRLLRVRWKHEACLHLPVAGCSEGTRAWVDGERRKEVGKWRAMGEAA